MESKSSVISKYKSKKEKKKTRSFIYFVQVSKKSEIGVPHYLVLSSKLPWANKTTVGREVPLALPVVTLSNPSDFSPWELALQKQRHVQGQQLHNGRLSLGIFYVTHVRDTMVPRPNKNCTIKCGTIFPLKYYQQECITDISLYNWFNVLHGVRRINKTLSFLLHLQNTKLTHTCFLNRLWRRCVFISLYTKLKGLTVRS